MNIPASAPDAKRHMTWYYPVQSVAIGLCFPSINGQQKVALVVVFFIVLNGWLSDAALDSRVRYNDVLLISDLALIVSYCWLFAEVVLGGNALAPQKLWYPSSQVFFLYALWNLGASPGGATEHTTASRRLLRRFIAIDCSLGVLCVLFGLSTSNGLFPNLGSFSLWSILWISVLIWWHFGKLNAAMKDSE